MSDLYDRRLQEIRELRAAITANDAHLQKVEALNAALLAALENISDDTDDRWARAVAGEAIAKAKAGK